MFLLIINSSITKFGVVTLVKNNSLNIKKEFNQFASVYDKTITQEMQYTAHQIIPEQIVKHYLADLSSAQVLDLGCGTGISSQTLIAHGCKVTGVDISKNMLELAQVNGLQPLFCQNIEETWNFAHGKFYNIILVLGVMDFIQQPKYFLQQLFSHLIPNGIVGITIPSNLPKGDNELNMRCFTNITAKELFKQNGFKIIWEQYFLGYSLEVDNQVKYQGYVLQKCANNISVS